MFHVERRSAGGKALSMQLLCVSRGTINLLNVRVERLTGRSVPRGTPKELEPELLCSTWNKGEPHPRTRSPTSINRLNECGTGIGSRQLQSEFLVLSSPSRPPIHSTTLPAATCGDRAH